MLLTCHFALFQFILAVLAMLHPPSRAYIDPWTGQLFGEGGVEKTLKSYLPMNNSIPKPIVGVEGGVIMTKLGNETTKYCLPLFQSYFCLDEFRAALGRATWKFLCVTLLRQVYCSDQTQYPSSDIQ